MLVLVHEDRAKREIWGDLRARWRLTSMTGASANIRSKVSGDTLPPASVGRAIPAIRLHHVVQIQQGVERQLLIGIRVEDRSAVQRPPRPDVHPAVHVVTRHEAISLASRRDSYLRHEGMVS